MRELKNTTARTYEGPSKFAFTGNQGPFKVTGRGELPEIETKEDEDDIHEYTCNTDEG